MKTIGERIKAARLAKGLKQEELAELVGAKYRSVSTWELGTAKPDCLMLLRICESLNVSPDQILGYPSDTPTSSELTMLHRYKCLDDYGRQAVDAILAIEYERAFSVQPKKSRARLLKIDYYSTPASAGTGNFLESETPEQILVKETPEAERADLVIRIVGDSMEPTFHNDDKVFVEKCDAIREGEIGIFIINGDAFIKELGSDCLISHNGAYHPIKLSDNDSIYCCGRVLGIVEN